MRALNYGQTERREPRRRDRGRGRHPHRGQRSPARARHGRDVALGADRRHDGRRPGRAGPRRRRQRGVRPAHRARRGRARRNGRPVVRRARGAVRAPGDRRPAAAADARLRRGSRARRGHRARDLLGGRGGAALRPRPDRAAPARTGVGRRVGPHRRGASVASDAGRRANRPVLGDRRPGVRRRPTRSAGRRRPRGPRGGAVGRAHHGIRLWARGRGGPAGS